MAGLVKKCTYCRKDLEEGTEPGVPPSVHCERCQKNEVKYGKPGVCKHCHLPAAFFEEKCVYCAHSERKHGPPFPCANCSMKSYFDPTKKGRKGLCRLCINHAHSQNLEEMKGVRVPAHELPVSRKEKDKKRPSTSSSSAAAPPPKIPKQPASDGDHILQVQQLKDKISELQSTIRKRDDSLIEKDKKIASLRAEMMTSERESRQRMDQLKRDHEKNIIAIHDRYKEQKIAKQKEKEANNKDKDAGKESKDKEIVSF